MGRLLARRSARRDARPALALLMVAAMLGGVTTLLGGPATATPDEATSPQVAVSLHASPQARPEPGGDFTLTLAAANPSSGPITVTDVVVDPVAPGTDLSGCAALVGRTIDPDGSVDCEITVVHHGPGNHQISVQVTVAGADGATAWGHAAATVAVIDALPSLALAVTATPDTLTGADDVVTYRFLVTNTSAASDPVVVTSLVADTIGDLGGRGSCLLPVALEPGAILLCEVAVTLGVGGPEPHVTIVSVAGHDDEDNPATAQATTTVRRQGLDPADVAPAGAGGEDTADAGAGGTGAEDGGAAPTAGAVGSGVVQRAPGEPVAEVLGARAATRPRSGPGTLPRTGSDTGQLLLWATVATGTGLMLLLEDRRVRRHREAVAQDARGPRGGGDPELPWQFTRVDDIFP